MFGVGGGTGRQDCLFQRAGNKRVRLQNLKLMTDPKRPTVRTFSTTQAGDDPDGGFAGIGVSRSDF